MIWLFLTTIISTIFFAASQGITEAYVWNKETEKRVVDDTRTYHWFRAVEIMSNIFSNLCLIVMFYSVDVSYQRYLLKVFMVLVGRHFIFQVVYRFAFIMERGQPLTSMSRPRAWDVGNFDIPYPSNFAYAVGIPFGIVIMALAIFV